MSKKNNTGAQTWARDHYEMLLDNVLVQVGVLNCLKGRKRKKHAEWLAGLVEDLDRFANYHGINAPVATSFNDSDEDDLLAVARGAGLV